MATLAVLPPDWRAVTALPSSFQAVRDVPSQTADSLLCGLSQSRAWPVAEYVPPMQLQPGALEQHIAVFGESGSGKTVMLSSFYGATQEPQFLKSSLFYVVADDIEQGHRLHRNYLGMRDSARRP